MLHSSDHSFYVRTEKEKFMCVFGYLHTRTHLYTYVYSKTKLQKLKVLFLGFHCDVLFLWATIRYFHTLVLLLSLHLLKLLKSSSQPPGGLAGLRAEK